MVEYTQRKIYHLDHFKVLDSVAFSIFTVLCNLHHCLIPEHFITQKENPIPIKQSLPIPHYSPALGYH